MRKSASVELLINTSIKIQYYLPSVKSQTNINWHLEL
jgi:hypothetical protein